MESSLIQRIRDRKAVVAIVGLGYVGLPTSVFFAEKGYQVIGCELRSKVVDAVNEGRSPLEDLNLDDRIRAVVNSRKLRATTDVTSGASEADVVLVAVPTPTKEGFEPDLKYVVTAGESIRAGLHRGQLIVLESTVYPGVTEEVFKPLLEKGGLRAGTDFGLAYCPERYNPGDVKHGIDQVTRVLGGITPEWTKAAAALYEQVTKIHEVSDIRTAEMAKIIENTQRDLNIALMNEIALICETMGLDVMEVIRAAATKWNFSPYLPGPGVGGHCLPKDPWYLVKAAEKSGYHAQIITAGRRINDGMPHHVFQLLVRSMNKIGKPIKGSKVVILGLAYKENIGDTRNSPAIPLVREINAMGGTTVSVDPYVDSETAAAELGLVDHRESMKGVFSEADSVVLLTAHDEFRNIDFGEVIKEMKRDPIFVDSRRIYEPSIVQKAGIIYVGIGRG